MSKKIAFIHHVYPLGGGEKVTSLLGEYLHKTGLYEAPYIFVSKLDRKLLLPYESQHFHFIELPAKLQSKASARFIIEEINRLGINFFVMPSIRYKHLSLLKTHTQCKLIYHLHFMPSSKVLDKLSRADHNAQRKGSKLMKWLKFLTCATPELLFGLYTWSDRRTFTKIYNRVDRFVVLCEGYRHEMEAKLGIEAQQSRIRAQYNPLQSYTLPLPQTKRNEVLFMGRLSYPDKRVDRLIRIWSQIEDRHPDWTLKIVGDGKERGYLEKMVQQLGLQRVKFCGYSKNVGEHYATAAILCLTSTFEGWPLTLVEAQSMGVVPIAFDCSEGVKEIVGTDGKKGVLVEKFKEDKFAKQLSALIADKARRDEMREEMQRSIARYDIDVIGREWTEMLDEMSHE